MSIPNSIQRWESAVKATLNRGNYSDLQPNLIYAIIEQESAGNPWAWNPEPRYRWLWNVSIDVPFRKLTPDEILSQNPPSDFPCLRGDRDQEWWGQQASWGLMQVMGAAAREQRFKGDYLTELCDPYVNIEYGVRHLWNYAFQFGNRTVEQALGRWNAGSAGNPVYAAEVLAKLAVIERG